MGVRWEDSHPGPLGMVTGLGFGLGETVDRAIANSGSDVCRTSITQQTQSRLNVSFLLLGHSFY